MGTMVKVTCTSKYHVRKEKSCFLFCFLTQSFTQFYLTKILFSLHNTVFNKIQTSGQKNLSKNKNDKYFPDNSSFYSTICSLRDWSSHSRHNTPPPPPNTHTYKTSTCSCCCFRFLHCLWMLVAACFCLNSFTCTARSSDITESRRALDGRRLLPALPTSRLEDGAHRIQGSVSLWKQKMYLWWSCIYKHERWELP